MSQNKGKNNNKVYILVLTGGPCGGKTTGQARLCTFFENIGWKVYRVPETATVLMGGGVKWNDLSSEQTFRFQEDLLKTMMNIENAFFNLAGTGNQDTLVICDRGTMDASAYLQQEDWARMRSGNAWNEVELRDRRYNQVIHMVSAAKGAEKFYQTEHVTRHENVELARHLDDLTAQAWVGHPYYDVIDNTSDFERKIVRMIAAVCNRLGIDAGDRLAPDSRKRKFLIQSLPDDESLYPKFQDFIVAHDYLVTPNSKMQARIRRRGQNVKKNATTGRWDMETGEALHDSGVADVQINQQQPQQKPYLSSCVRLDAAPLSQRHLSRQARGHARLTMAMALHATHHGDKCIVYGGDKDLSNWTYTHTIRRPAVNEESPELKMQVNIREYELLLAQKDMTHYSIYKKRRCFLWDNQYFQMDIYQEPCPPKCRGLIILETYTTQGGEDFALPDFLEIEREVTKDSEYSMYNMSKKPASVINSRVRSISEGEESVAKLPRSNGHRKQSVNLDSSTGALINGHVTQSIREELMLNGSSSNSAPSSAAPTRTKHCSGQS